MSELADTSLIKRGINAFNSRIFRHWSLMAIAALLTGPVSVGLYYMAATADSTIVANPSFVLVAGLLDGLYYGVLQWIVLRKLFRHAYWWIVVTSLSYMFLRPLFEQIGVRILKTFADPSVWGVAAFFQSSLAYGLTYWLFFAVRADS